MNLKRSTEYLLLICCLIINSSIPVGIAYADGNVIEMRITMDDRLTPNSSLAKQYVRIADITPPQVDVYSLKAEPKEVQPGDQVKVSLKVTDDLSGVRYVRVYYQSPITDKIESVTLSNSQGDNYEGYFNVTDTTEDGEWQISYIYIDDAQNNSQYIYNVHTNPYIDLSEDLSAGNFTVSGTNADITSPKADISSLKVDFKEVQPGDQVKVSLKVTDDLSGVRYVRVYYQSPITGKIESVTLSNSQGDNYEGYFNVTDTTEDGEWQISYIYIDDAQNNSQYIYNVHTNPYIDLSEDLSTGNFTVSGTNADITSPKADISSLKVDFKEVQPGDQVKVSLKVTDDLSGVRYVRVYYQSPITGKIESVTLSNSQGDNYEGYFNVTDTTEDGEWQISYIYIDDAQNNSQYIYNVHTNPYIDLSEDLSTGNFTVSNAESSIAPLDGVTFITQNDTWSNKTINGDLYIGPNAVLTVNGNVKVDGNVYVLGALKSYGGLTINGTLYGKNMSFGSSLMLHNGTIVINGTNSIYSMNMSNYPVTDLPIRIDNLPLVSNNGKVTIQGATVNVAQMYIEGEEVKLDNKGRFDLIDFYVGNKDSIIIKFKTVFGNIITKQFEISQENIIKEDINNDGIINKQDLELLSNYYNVTRSDYNWNEELDMNDDGIIDLYDAVFISKKIEDEENVDIVVTHFEVDKIGGSIRYKFPNNNATFSQVEVLVNDENVTANLIGAGGGGPEGGNMFWTFTDELVQGENKIEVRITYTIDEKSSMISKVTSILK